MIMKQEVPDKGEFQVGETVRIGYVDQQHKEIDLEKTPWEIAYRILKNKLRLMVNT